MRLKNKKAFTIIELIVVIAVLGILVLMGMPKLIGYTSKAQLSRIQHDTKIMQDKMEELFSDQKVTVEEWPKWEDNYKDLGVLVMSKQLYEIEGVADKIDKSHIKFPKYNWANSGGDFYAHQVGYQDIDGNDIEYAGELGVGGGAEEELVGLGYKIIPDKYKSEIKTRLKGTFYSNPQGKVYYEPNKPITNSKVETPLNCVAANTLDYNFEHLTGTIVKYTGNSQYVIIPESFLFEKQCWPVKIIGTGAFRRGEFPRDIPIKGVILPPGLEEIQEDAFKDNEIEAVIIPPGVTIIKPGAFGDNHIGKDNVMIEGTEGSIVINSGAFDPAVNPIYRPVTDKSLGVIIKPNRDNDGNVIKTPSGRPSGSISSGGNWSTGSSSSNSWGPGSSANNSNPSKPSQPNNKVVIIPDVIEVGGIEVEIVEVDKGAFQGEGIIDVSLPSGLQRIEDYAFAGNQLIGVHIPSKVEYVGNYAFGYNEVFNGSEYMWTIKSINFKNNEQINNVDRKIGSIVDNKGEKVNQLLDSRLLNYIWINSNSTHIASSKWHTASR